MEKYGWISLVLELQHQSCLLLEIKQNGLFLQITQERGKR